MSTKINPLTGKLDVVRSDQEILDVANTVSAPVDSVNGQTGVVNIAASDIGLGNVDNTSDLDKPVSNAVQSELDQKLDSNNIPVEDVNGQTGNVSLDKFDIGLSAVDNTSDLNKPISTATQAALDLKLDASSAPAPDSVTDVSVASYTVTATDKNLMLRRTGSIAITLPDPSANLGRKIRLYNSNGFNDHGVVTITGTGNDFPGIVLPQGKIPGINGTSLTGEFIELQAVTSQFVNYWCVVEERITKQLEGSHEDGPTSAYNLTTAETTIPGISLNISPNVDKELLIRIDCMVQPTADTDVFINLQLDSVTNGRELFYRARSVTNQRQRVSRVFKLNVTKGIGRTLSLIGRASNTNAFIFEPSITILNEKDS